MPNQQEFNLAVYLWQNAPALALAILVSVTMWRRLVAKDDAYLADLRGVVRAADSLTAVTTSNAALVATVTALTAKVESFEDKLAEQHEECERLRDMVRERLAVEAAESNLRKAGPQSVRGR